MKLLTSLSLLALVCCLFACGPEVPPCDIQDPTQANALRDSLAQHLKWPEDLAFSYFSGPEITPSPACLAVGASGEVFVGVDMIGSLGKEPGKGYIAKLIDCNQDGVADSHTIFAKLDDPRGLLPIGDQLFVLYTTFSPETGIASGMDLAVLEDKDQDGIADGPPKPLIQHISSPKFLQSRGTDHATNGIRMGIDGWIYIAVGDFGFHEAIDRDGKKHTMLGGGILRVRPDGTETEVYTHGLRNIYDVAIDPFMNVFTRGNTNDGGGWNIRFIHQVQSGEYGYPVLFKHFTDEIIPALVDVGGGSGTGSFFLDDPRWPASYNQQPLMADWGRNELYLHRLTADGGSFQQKEERFIELPQITDVDVDAAGQMFLSAWDGAGYKGDSSKGFVVRVVPKGWKYEPFPRLQDVSERELIRFLQSESTVVRLHTQQELLRRGGAGESVWQIVNDKSQSLEVRVAALFTYAQLKTSQALPDLRGLCTDPDLKEFALRAMTDRISLLPGANVECFTNALNDPSERVQIAARVGLGRLGKTELAEQLLQTKVPASAVAPAIGTEGLHAQPNSAIIPAHVAVRSLVSLQAVEACVNAIGGENSQLALWALRYMHDPRAVEGLIAAYRKTSDPDLQHQILTTLSRLYQKEAPYDGSWWWSTRPDTHGPYYKTTTWEGSADIKAFLQAQWKLANTREKAFFAELNGRHRMGIEQFGGMEEQIATIEDKVDLGLITNKKGQVGKASIEDVMLAMGEVKGDAALGAKLFVQQGCVACHSIQKGETMKGPFMGQIGSIMSREQIAESILKPNASISQGFASVLITAKGNKSYAGFVSEESADKVVMRNIAGQVFTINTADIVSRQELETSMMPPGLANALSYDEFASLITYLSEQKK